MIILVGVVLVINGGLFDEARSASDEMQYDEDRDALVSVVLGSKDSFGYVNYSVLDRNLPKGFTKAGDKKYKSSKGNIFTVNENGDVIFGEGSGRNPPGISDEELFNLEKYILGDNLTGRNVEEIFNMNTGQFTNSDITFLNGNVNNSVFGAGTYRNDVFNGETHVYFKYKNDGNIYRTRIGTSERNLDGETTRNGYTIPEDGIYKLKIIPADTNIGKTALIEGEKFIVLYDAGEKGPNVQLVSANTLAHDLIYIGYEDNMVDWTASSVISEANIFNDTEAGENVLSNIEKTIYSYNHAIENLNKVLEADVAGITNTDLLDIRCVGTDPINKYNENSNMHDTEFTEGMPANNNKYAQGAFNGKLKDGDTNYAEDMERMWLLGIKEAENEYDYWIASRICDYETDQNTDQNLVKYIDYNIRHGQNTESSILRLNSNSQTNGFYTFSQNRGLRPVITIKADSLSKYLINDNDNNNND